MYLTVNKNEQINVRVKPELKAALESLAEFHGLTVSSYVHSILTRHVRQEREGIPEAFGGLVRSAEINLAPVVARIEPSDEEKMRREIRQEIQTEPRKRKAG